MREPGGAMPEKLDSFRYVINKKYREGMRTDAVIYATDNIMDHVMEDKSFEQIVNVSMLRGIVGNAMAMPDIHYGYGFPIGGVAAFDYEEGIISPGGVGYDINCGVRLLRTGLYRENLNSGEIKELADDIFRSVPSGVGVGGKLLLDEGELREVANHGAKWCRDHGYADDKDIRHIEENGEYTIADDAKISSMAYKRGRKQLGTLGAGNHFMEIQSVDEIFNERAASLMGIEKGEITIMIHTGSRGFGHQVCSDYVKIMRSSVKKYGIDIPDPQLSCAPVTSDEGQDYLKAMAGAANYAWANRQIITAKVRDVFMKRTGSYPELVYDVAHNIAKVETHEYGGEKRKLVVHRKGATRAFGPGNQEVPIKYRDIGQPVLIPGDMGTASYVLTGTEKAMNETFGSTCHGAGRVMSRKAATKAFDDSTIKKELSENGIYISASDKGILAEEAPGAYKDINDVVSVVAGAGISRRVAKLIPVAVIKG